MLAGAIFGGLMSVIKAVLPSAKDLATVVLGDKSARDTSAADENKAAQEAYSKEWSYSLGAARTWFDGLIDGLNRLPRPLMAFGIIGLFVWTCVDPPAASRAFVALALIPEALWNIAIIIVCFFFLSRAIEKVPLGKYSVSKATQEMARKMVTEARQEPASARLASLAPSDATQPLQLAAPAGDDLMGLAGFGRGVLTTTGYTGVLPKSRAAGWRNPIAQQYAAQSE